MIKLFILSNKKNLAGITIWPFIILRKESKYDLVTINHESIHIQQQKELLIIPFYIVYFWFSFWRSYSKNPFEKEAYANAENLDYLKTRTLFSWTRYL